MKARIPRDWRSANPPNQELIVDASRKRSAFIEEALFHAAHELAAPSSADIALVTRDYRNRVLYSPISNVGRENLRNLVGAGEHTLLSAFRSQLVSGRRVGSVVSLGEGAISRLRVEGLKAYGKCLLVEVFGDGSAGRVFGWRKGTILPEGRGEWLESSLDKRTLAFLMRFPDDNDVDSNARLIFFRKGAERLQDELGRPFELFQTGFVRVLSNALEESVDVILTDLERNATISEAATLATLLEKERYYEKGVRQAIRGEMVKLDKMSVVAAEVGSLISLQQRRRTLFVPQLLGVDEDIRRLGWQEEDEARALEGEGWYRMQQLTLTTLSDLLTTVRGFDEFELQRILAGCITHLENTYWGSNKRTHCPRPNVKSHLSALLAFANSGMDYAMRSFVSRAKAVADRVPVKMGGKVGFYRPWSGEVVSKFCDLLKSEAEEFYLKVAHDGDESGEESLMLCQPGGSCFSELWEAIGRLDEDEMFEMADAREVHGDAHFANLMVDASVPEDPLVFSIDQGSVVFSAEQRKWVVTWLSDHERGHGLAGGKSEWRKLVREAGKHERRSIHYDFAKLMMSCACAYPIAYRQGTVVELENMGEGRVLFKISSREPDPEELSEAGGLSGAQIVRVDAPVFGGAWRYHRQAAAFLGESFIECLRGHKKISGRHMVVGLVCVWLMTIRHAFLIGQRLFPREIPGAMTLYLMALRLLNQGKGPVIAALNGEGEDWRSLLDIFQGGFGE